MTKLLMNYLSSFTTVHRISLILFFVILFWIVFILIYLTSRCILRLISKFKRKDIVQTKSNQVFIISSNNQFGSFRPSRSDSLFSNSNFALTCSSSDPINHQQQCQTSLLEHYLKTYNPLQIDLTTSNIEINSIEKVSSETDTQTLDNCYSLSCTNKQSCYSTEYYRKLQESSAQISTIDEPISDSTNSTILPIFMITDCSNNQRLHTDIIEEE